MGSAQTGWRCCAADRGTCCTGSDDAHKPSQNGNLDFNALPGSADGVEDFDHGLAEVKSIAATCASTPRSDPSSHPQEMTPRTPAAASAQQQRSQPSGLQTLKKMSEASPWGSEASDIRLRSIIISSGGAVGNFDNSTDFTSEHWRRSREIKTSISTLSMGLAPTFGSGQKEGRTFLSTTSELGAGSCFLSEERGSRPGTPRPSKSAGANGNSFPFQRQKSRVTTSGLSGSTSEPVSTQLSVFVIHEGGGVHEEKGCECD